MKTKKLTDWVMLLIMKVSPLVLFFTAICFAAELNFNFWAGPEYQAIKLLVGLFFVLIAYLGYVFYINRPSRSIGGLFICCVLVLLAVSHFFDKRPERVLSLYFLSGYFVWLAILLHKGIDGWRIISVKYFSILIIATGLVIFLILQANDRFGYFVLDDPGRLMALLAVAAGVFVCPLVLHTLMTLKSTKDWFDLGFITVVKYVMIGVVLIQFINFMSRQTFVSPAGAIVFGFNFVFYLFGVFNLWLALRFFKELGYRSKIN